MLCGSRGCPVMGQNRSRNALHLLNARERTQKNRGRNRRKRREQDKKKGKSKASLPGDWMIRGKSPTQGQKSGGSADPGTHRLYDYDSESCIIPSTSSPTGDRLPDGAPKMGNYSAGVRPEPEKMRQQRVKVRKAEPAYRAGRGGEREEGE